MAKIKHKVTGVVVEVADEVAEKLLAVDYEAVTESRSQKPRSSEK